jgi:hypothetical protein
VLVAACRVMRLTSLLVITATAHARVGVVETATRMCPPQDKACLVALPRFCCTTFFVLVLSACRGRISQVTRNVVQKLGPLWSAIHCVAGWGAMSVMLGMDRLCTKSVWFAGPCIQGPGIKVLI